MSWTVTNISWIQRLGLNSYCAALRTLNTSYLKIDGLVSTSVNLDPTFWDSLSLNLKIINLSRLPGQQTSAVFLFLLPSVWVIDTHSADLAFYISVKESEFEVLMFTVHKPYSHRVIFLALFMNIQIVCELCITDVFINPPRLWAN